MIATLIMNGDLPEVTDFPWHATLYKSETPDGDKKFICGATIIRSDLLITAAYCVFEKSANQVEDQEKFIIVTGNMVQAFNSDLHNSNTVKRAKVRDLFHSFNSINFFIDCQNNQRLEISRFV